MNNKKIELRIYLYLIIIYKNMINLTCIHGIDKGKIENIELITDE